MNRKLKLTIIGNSVAMRVRPAEPYPENRNYHSVLSEADFEVQNLAKGGNTIKSAFKDLDTYIRSFPDIFILNFGVVDASTREVPKWFFNLYNSTGQYWYNRFSRWIYNGLIKKARKPLVVIRGKRSWVGKKTYKRLYSMMTERLLKETNAIVIGLSINTADDRVEKALPGSRKNHLTYNQLMEDILNQERCYFIPIQDNLTPNDYPDGVHYSRSGHEIVAKKISELIEEL